MYRRAMWPGLAILATAALAPALVTRPALAQTAPPGERLDAVLKPYLASHTLPAIAAAVVRNGAVIASGAVGTRRVGTDIPVTINDRFHIGSDTKAMTALLAGMFVEEGKLRWDSRVAEIFPELAPTMDADLRGVTLTQLLSHTSGLPGDTDEIAMEAFMSGSKPGNLDAQRYWLLQQAAPRKLASRPGERWSYANLGYVFIGAILERVSGKTWEELVVTRVFDALNLKTAGLGPQSSLGRVDAPLGHDMQDGKLFAYFAGPNGDNPEAIGPAGTAHLSVLDFAAWAGWQAGEGKRGPALVKPETLRRMHTRVIDMPMRRDAATGTPARGSARDAGYALGWGMVTLSISAEPFLFHGGSNTKNFAIVMLQPKYDFAMVLMTNAGTEKADAGLNALAASLYAKYGPAPARP